jgi:hypothetical protein
MKMQMIERPQVSHNFTIEDIHKIREWNYERKKSMTAEEIEKEDMELKAEWDKKWVANGGTIVGNHYYPAKKSL